MEFDAFLGQEPYALEKREKEVLLLRRMEELTRRHRENCPPYARMLDGVFPGRPGLEGAPFLPVRLFKEMALRSVPEEAVVKTMTSSGTSGQSFSRIELDR